MKEGKVVGPYGVVIKDDKSIGRGKYEVVNLIVQRYHRR
jgi:hypothetical protein